MSAMELLVVALLGGALSLDAVSVAQTMISRPIVAATLIGFLCGSPESGLVIGAILELLACETMPFGASRYLEWSCGAVVASLFAAKQPGLSAPVLLTATVFALAAAWLAGFSMVVLRRINGWMIASRRGVIETGDASVLSLLQASGMALDFVRGSVVVSVAALAAFPLGGAMVSAMSAPAHVRISVLVAIPGAVALAACWRIFAAGPARRYVLLAGVAAGLTLAAVL